MHPRPHVTDRDHASPHPTSPHPSSPHRTSPHRTSPHPSPHLIGQDARIATRDDISAIRWSELRPELGARGAIVTMFMSSLIGNLAAQYLHAVRLTGFGFAVGCIAAASLTRRRALLVVLAIPPLIFLVAITCAQALAAHADHVDLSARRIAAGVLLTLASTAPWLFGGFAGALVIGTCRALPGRSR
jgi:hypothetical protein